MILEIDTAFIQRLEPLTINQLVLLNLVMNDYQNNHQDVRNLISLVSEEEIQDLVQRELLSIQEIDNSTIIKLTPKFFELTKVDKSNFDQFFDEYPIYVDRPDGTKGFLRSNLNKCRKEYNRITGRSKAMHEHIMNCLRFEKQQKAMTGKLGYMKTMWKWLTQREWEIYEDQMNMITNTKDDRYGTEVI